MTGRAANPRMVPTAVAAMAAGVTPATIRKWASRGKITRYGRPGRAEYDIEELLSIVVDRQAREVAKTPPFSVGVKAIPEISG